MCDHVLFTDRALLFVGLLLIILLTGADDLHMADVTNLLFVTLQLGHTHLMADMIGMLLAISVRYQQGRMQHAHTSGQKEVYQNVLERNGDFYDREFPILQCTEVLSDENVSVGDCTGTTLKRFVSFYFTIVPEFIPYSLRKGFEVCGILEALFVARNYNAQGKIYGFMHYSNVRNVEKLTKALNVVTIGVFRVFDKVARLDRFEKKVEGQGKAVVGRGIEGEKKCEGGILKKVGEYKKKGWCLLRAGKVWREEWAGWLRGGASYCGRRCGVFR